MQQVITIVGASVRAAACSAARAGYSVRAADLFADVDLRSITNARAVADYPAGLEAVLSGPQPGAWLYTGALENYPELVERWARLRPLLGNSADVLCRVRQPQIVAQALRRFGLPHPEVANSLGHAQPSGHWIRKRLRSAGGLHVKRLEDPHRTTDAAEDQAAGGHYFQQFVEGTSCSAVYLAAGGRSVLLGATRQLTGLDWTGAVGFQYCGSIGPLALDHSTEASLARLGEVLAAEFGVVGLIGVDAIINPDGVWPVEINPRYTASIELLERAREMAAIQLHDEACSGGTLPAVCCRPAKGLFGKAILYAPRRFVVTDKLLESIAPSGDARWPALADLPAVGSVIQPGWPVFTIFAEASDQLELISRLKQHCAAARAAIG